MLEILGDQRIPYEGERKRFRAEGDFLVRALVDLISQCLPLLCVIQLQISAISRFLVARIHILPVAEASRCSGISISSRCLSQGDCLCSL